MTKEQKRLIKLHGTLHEFNKALTIACSRSVISLIEADIAYNKYKEEWKRAGQKIKIKKLKPVKLDKAYYKTLYENLSKRISRLHAYSDRTGNRVLKNIAYGQPDHYGS